MSCENCEESSYVIDKLAKLLTEIAVIVNGPEPPLTRWSYHDLPEKVRALKQAQQPAAAVPPMVSAYFAGLDHTGRPIYRQVEQAPPAAVPEGYELVPVEPTEAMLDVMHDRVRILCNPAEKSASIRNDREVWAAMLAAANKENNP